MKLRAVRALVTGGSQGFGYAVAQRFLQEGASVMVCARTAEQLHTAATTLRRDVPGGQLHWSQADVSTVADVVRITTEAESLFGGVDVLVCNAGVYGPKGRIEDIDWDAWLYALQVNLCGAIACCRAVLPAMRARRSGKIILLSGGGATKPMPYLSAYAASKAALVRFGETLAEEVKADGIDVNAIAPGALNTRLVDEILEAGPARVGQAFYEQSIKQKETGGTPFERGTDLCVFLASRDSDGITGRLLSAVWDPWQTLASHIRELDTSDIYTLRRIVPEDRAKDWS